MIFSVVGISLLTSCGRSGKVEITPYILNLHLKYTHIDNFEHGIARVSMDTKTESGRETAVYGCIDVRGKEVIPCIYELVFVEPGGIVALSKEGGVQTFCLSRRWGRGILPPVRYSADKRFLLRP